MATSFTNIPQFDLRREADAIRSHWLSFVLLGIALLVIGTVALSSAFIASLATAIAIGALMFVGGITELAGALWARQWSGFFFFLLSGILWIVVGMLFLRAPVDALLAMTLLLACLLMVSGIFHIAASLIYRVEAWGWSVFSGVIDLLLGSLIWSAWPASALWVIGLYAGISLIVRGINWIGLGLTLHAPLTERGTPAGMQFSR